MKPPSRTIGSEGEYQIIDPQTRELRSYITEILEEGKLILLEQVKPELHQAMVEVGSSVCQTPAELRVELGRLRRAIMDLAAKNGLKIVAAGTHPFSYWMTQEITPQERYMGVKQDMQELAQRMLIFGTHVHVGIEDREFLIDAMNVVRYLMPHLLALSTSSPFWMGRNTGLKSYRSVIWSNFPRTGIPPELSSFDEYENYVQLLVKTGSIDDGKKIWWDLRAHPTFPTLEFRVCDMPTRLEETICLAALMQAICAKLLRLRGKNLGFRKYMPALIAENKWRAIRYGIDGNLIDFGKQAEVPMRDLALELVEFVDDVVDDRGSRKAVEHVHTILEGGTSAARQRRGLRATGDAHKVVELLAAETVPTGARPPQAERIERC